MIRSNYILSIITCFCSFIELNAQVSIQEAGMEFSYTVVDNALHCTLEAPTTGWIGVGFNSKNTIVGSDLILFNIVNGQVTSTDLYVKGAGNPVRDDQNGGSNTVTVIAGKESRNATTVSFKLPLDSGDQNDFKHKIGKEAWLILAYSVADEFEHHSRIRKHVPFTLEAK